MSTSVDGNYSAKNSNKVWGKDLNETSYVDPNVTYRPIDKTGINSSGGQGYTPEAISSLDAIGMVGFNEEDKNFLKQYISDTEVNKFQQSLKSVISDTTSLFYEVSNTPPTSTAEMSAQLDKHFSNVSVSFGEVLKILVELLENMSNMCPEFKSIIDSLHKIGSDRVQMSKVITFIKQTITDLQNQIIIEEQQKAREEAAKSAKWAIFGAALGALIAAVTLVSAFMSGGASLALLPAVIGAISAAYSLANTVKKYEWLQDNADNHTDGHAEELRGGILTACFGMNPDTVHKLEDVATIVQVVLSLSTAVTSLYNMGATVKLFSTETIGGGKVALGIFTNLVTFIIGGLSAAQDVYCKVKDIQGDKKGAEEGFLFEGISDKSGDTWSHGSWFLPKYLNGMFEIVGDKVAEPIASILPGMGEDEDTKRIFSDNYGNDAVTKREMAKMFLGIIGNVAAQFGSTFCWDTKWDNNEDIKSLVQVRKRLEQMTSQTSKLTILVQLVDITKQMNQADFQKYENSVNVILKELDARSTLVQGTQHASEVVQENLMKIYQEYMRILGKTQEDLENTIKSAVGSFTSGITGTFNTLVK